MTSTPGERPAHDAGASDAGGAGAFPGDTSAAAPPGEAPRRRRALAGAALLLAALPAIFYLCLVPRTGRLQWHDYYIVLLGMRVDDHLHADVGRWLTIKSNEHTVTIPALIYAANLVLFHGDNRPRPGSRAGPAAPGRGAAAPARTRSRHCSPPGCWARWRSRRPRRTSSCSGSPA